jgi:hypothetical protein
MAVRSRNELLVGAVGAGSLAGQGGRGGRIGAGQHRGGQAAFLLQRDHRGADRRPEPLGGGAGPDRGAGFVDGRHGGQ